MKCAYKHGEGMFEGYLTRVVNIKGFAVLELTHPEQEYLGLAFCSPKDRVNGKWSRDTGSRIAYQRMIDPDQRIVNHDGWSVQRAVMDAVVQERQQVPWEISDPLLNVLHEEKAARWQCWWRPASRPAQLDVTKSD